MPPSAGDTAPDFEALLCRDGTFRAATLYDELDREGSGGGVLVFSAFAFSAIAENWWKRYDRAGWDEFDEPVLGVSRDGPYGVTAFQRYVDSPFAMFADVDAAAASAYDLLVERDGMARVETPWRAVFVLDADREVSYRWIADDWISPVPREDVEAAVAEL